MTTRDVKLTLEEIVLLDGKVRPDLQAQVDAAKAALAIAPGLADSEAQMVAKIIEVAAKKGKLTLCGTNIRYCPCCGKSEGYHLVARSSRYKRRGEPDHDRPILMTGYDLDRGFVVMNNTIFTGFCTHCASRIKPVLADALRDIKAEIPEGITGVPSRYKWWQNMTCTACKWTGHEGELGLLRTLFGDGYHRGQCPNCQAKNEFLSMVIKNADGYTLVAVDEPAKEPK